jgi:transketolase
LRDTFAEGSRTGPYLFDKYGLSTQAVLDAAWTALGRRDRVPAAEIAAAEAGQYSPV